MCAVVQRGKKSHRKPACVCGNYCKRGRDEYPIRMSSGSLPIIKSGEREGSGRMGGRRKATSES